MEWVMFTTAASLFAFIVAVVTPIVKLNTTITKLTMSVDNIVDKLTKFEDKNSDSHSRIFKRIELNEESIQNHENRIQIMEGKSQWKQ